MALLTPIIYPDPRLQHACELVGEITPEIVRLTQDMLETMYHENCIGLAANQVGAMFRVITVDVSHDRNEPYVFINPEVVMAEGENRMDEPCLSFPGITVPITRPGHIRVRALNAQGETFEVEASGLFSQCIQHEIDHIDGKALIDYASSLKKRFILDKLRKYKTRLARNQKLNQD